MDKHALSDERMIEALAPFGLGHDEDLFQRVRAYIGTLLFWNSKMALTTVTDPLEIVRVHFGESFFAAGASGIAGGRVADIGTGPGFPGIPMRMVVPGIRLTLVESNAKKAAFLYEIVRELGLKDVDIMRCRMEEITEKRLQVDWISARAIGRYESLLDWSKAHLTAGGRMVLLLGDEDTRRLRASSGWNWREPIRIPGSDSKFVLVGGQEAE